MDDRPRPSAEHPLYPPERDQVGAEVVSPSLSPPAAPVPVALQRPRGLLFVALLLLLNVVLFGLLAYSSQDELRRWLGRDHDNGDEQTTGEKSALAGKPAAKDAKPADDDDADSVVVLSRNAQRAGGILTAKLARAAVPAAAGTPLAVGGAVASVPSLAPLFDLRTRYQAQQGDITAVQAAQARSAADLKRMQALHADDRNVSASALELALAQSRSDQARLQQAQLAARGTLDAIRQSWGRELADAVQGSDRGRLLQGLANREQVLVQVGIAKAVPPPTRVWLSTIDTAGAANDGTGEPTRAEQSATLVGPAIATDASLPATTFLYRTEPGNLRSGARLRVRLETAARNKDDDPDAGALVPFSAVIWYGGQAWAYVAEGEEKRGMRFERRLVDTRHETGGGWVQQERYKPGDEIVTVGAQWLLSKELKPRAIDNE